MLQEGDKVSFINEKQDGFVRKIKSDGIIVVEIEEGFTLEVNRNELVKIQTLSAFAKTESPTLTNEAPKVEAPNLIKALSLSEEIALIVLPESGKVLSGDITYYISNNSRLTALFTFTFRKNRDYEGKSMGIIAPGESTELTSVSHHRLMDVENLIVELLLFQEGNHAALPRIYKEFSVELPGIQQTFPKASAPLSFAIVKSLINFEEVIEPDMQELFDKYKPDTISNVPVSKQHSPSPQKIKIDTSLRDFGLSPVQNVVDLHIEELTENAGGMSSSEMIGLQLKQFQKELDKAMMSKNSKIVFIHGVGNGRLKNAIRSELTSLNLRFREAAYEKYGSGATEVYF